MSKNERHAVCDTNAHTNQKSQIQVCDSDQYAERCSHFLNNVNYKNSDCSAVFLLPQFHVLQAFSNHQFKRI